MEYFLNSPYSFFYVGWFFSFIVFGTWVYFFSESRRGKWIGFLFPGETYSSQSVKDDLKVIAFHGVTSYLFFISRISVQAVTFAFVSGLFFFDPDQSGKMGSAVTDVIAYIIFALALDFGNYLAHYLMHKVPFLWDYHKVHHSATHLAPTTQMRSHPVEFFLKEVCIGLISGAAVGAMLVSGLTRPEQFTFDNVFVFYFLFYLTIHLRHSHIWVSFGPYVSYVFSSPAMHQVHHSTEERHRDKNMAVIFSIWDALLGTLYIPKERESFEIGLDDSEEQRRFRGLRNLLLLPLKAHWARVRSLF